MLTCYPNHNVDGRTRIITRATGRHERASKHGSSTRRPPHNGRPSHSGFDSSPPESRNGLSCDGGGRSLLDLLLLLLLLLAQTTYILRSPMKPSPPSSPWYEQEMRALGGRAR